MTTHREYLREQLRAFLHALLFVPFIFAQFFAAGTMGHVGADGFEVVLCSGDGPVSVVIGPDGEPQPVDHSDQAVCAWAVATQVALSADHAAPVAIDVVWHRVEQAPPAETSLPTIVVAIPPARGPPTLV